MIFFLKKIGWYTLFLLYLWAKYESLWLCITAQAMTLVPTMLVKAQTITQNAGCVVFFLPKVVLTKDISILNMAKVLRYGFFCNIKICKNT